MHCENLPGEEILKSLREEFDSLLEHCIRRWRVNSTDIDHLTHMSVQQEFPPRWSGYLGYKVMLVDDTVGDGNDLCEQLWECDVKGSKG